MDSARQDFGWGMTDVLDAVCHLGKKHFYKAEPCRTVKEATVYYFKARRLLKEGDVYIKFYIDPESGAVQVQSCKRLT